jgi:type 1 fimbria pilin
MKLNNALLLGKLLFAVAGATLLLSTAVQAVDNMHFHGALVAEPCVLAPGDENISLDFGTVVDKYLYLNTRTNGQKFTLHLLECDTSVGKSVKITFLGTGSSTLPGLVALDGASQATGIAIGIETPGGRLLALNQASQGYSLIDGGNLISLQAYVQGEPEAVVNRTIQPGPFSAVVTFGLDYE